MFTEMGNTQKRFAGEWKFKVLFLLDIGFLEPLRHPSGENYENEI